MKITKDLGKATFIQFGVISLLSIASILNSIITTCHTEKGDCVSNTMVSLVLYILIVAWFGLVAVFGFAAQEKRKRWIIGTVIVMELAIAFFAYINAKGHTNPLGLVISVVDIILAIWIIYLALRLIRGGNKRVVRKQRTRQRKTNN